MGSGKNKKFYDRQWASQNPDKRRNSRLKRVYGISLEQYNEMFQKQNGCCAICLQPETRIFAGKISLLAVDHCHISGKIRALLCDNCNKGLGHFKDNQQVLRNAIKYLEIHEE